MGVKQRLLDIGCSVGHTLRAGTQLGFESVGVDLDPLAIRICHDAGMQAELATQERLPFVDGCFDVVMMKHVLEHSIDPRRSLKEVCRVLRPGGALFLAAPNAEYMKAAWSPHTSRFYRPEGNDHFVYFSPRTLTSLVNDVGFKAVRIHPHILHRHASREWKTAEVLIAPLLLLGGALRTLLRLRKEFWLVAQKV